MPMDNIRITPEATYEAVIADSKLFMGSLERLHSQVGTKFMGDGKKHEWKGRCSFQWSSMAGAWETEEYIQVHDGFSSCSFLASYTLLKEPITHQPSTWIGLMDPCCTCSKKINETIWSVCIRPFLPKQTKERDRKFIGINNKRGTVYGFNYSYIFTTSLACFFSIVSDMTTSSNNVSKH